MRLIKYLVAVAAMALLIGCNSYSYSNVKSADSSQKVRLVTITDGDGKLVGEKHELFDSQTGSWFEAATTAAGKFELTPAGKVAQARASSGDDGDDGGGGGGC